MNDAYTDICLLVVAVFPSSSSLLGIQPCVLPNFAYASKFMALTCWKRGKKLKYIGKANICDNMDIFMVAFLLV